MKYYLTILLLISFVACAESDLEETIAVTGNCTQNIIADRVSVELTIEEIDKVQSKSSDMANKKYNSLLNQIKELKLKNAEYETVEYRVFAHQPWENRKRVFKGYKTRIRLKISTSEMDKTGKLLTMGNNLGQKNVKGPNSFVSDKLYQQTYRKCLKISMNDAWAKAKILAKQAKRNLGKVLSINESQRSRVPTPRPMHSRGMEMMAKSAAPVAPKIEFSKSEIKMNVSVLFKLD